MMSGEVAYLLDRIHAWEECAAYYKDVLPAVSDYNFPVEDLILETNIEESVV